jgi:exosortase A
MINQIVKGLPIAIIFLAWFYTYYQGITTAIDVWSVSEIFNHCFLVIPGALFLMYQKRTSLCALPFITNFWLLVPLTGTSALYIFGYVGDIRLFMHIATFVSLPLLIWFVIGNQAAKTIRFPLYFILFSIPFGEQLIPFLQELTTDLAVPLLELTGVPIFRNGLYLDIPEGRFLVAEACSGISFLVASIVFGNLYAYLSFSTAPKQLMFVFISFAVPIIANALRVYGIILTAHLTDMEYAAGADHLIYGGVFYGIILFLLMLIGENFRDKIKLPTSKSTTYKKPACINYKSIVALVALLLIQNLWLSTVTANKSNVLANGLLADFTKLPLSVKEVKLSAWKPHYVKAQSIQQGQIYLPDEHINLDFFTASYSREGELISSVNHLYSAKRWTLVERKKIKLDNGEEVQLSKIVSPSGNFRHILSWYQFSGETFTSKIKFKLYQTMMIMLDKTQKSAIIALSVEDNESSESIISLLKQNAIIVQKYIKDELQ